MALHLQTLRTRSLTSAVFVLVMLAGLLLGEWAFLALLTIIHFGCWYEFIKLMKKIYSKIDWHILYGVAYITLPILLLIDLCAGREAVRINDATFMTIIPCIIIFSIWINDTMAYIVGSIIGKTPFSK